MLLWPFINYFILSVYFRMIRRAPGLKLVVQTLLYSLKPIGNTVLIAAFFFVVFGILGVQVHIFIQAELFILLPAFLVVTCLKSHL